MGPPPASSSLSFVPVYGDLSADMRPPGVVFPLSEEQRPADAVVPQACYDACSKWLELAIRYVSDAQVAKLARVAAYEGAEDGAKIAELEWEFEASLQAIVACATAVEALAAMLRTRLDLPRSLAERRRDAETPDELQMAEVFQRALSLPPDAQTALRHNLGEILRFRDLAVGRTPKTDHPVLHPELQTGVDWRFAYFRSENALTIVRATLRLIWELTAFSKPGDADLQKYVDAVRSRIEAIPGSHPLRTWRASPAAPAGGEHAPADTASPAAKPATST